jgi:endonuclease YncB( thermonuclease family)
VTRLLSFLLLTFILIPSSTVPVGGSISSAVAAQTLVGRVTHVFDGDTLELADSTRRRVRVRLYGIDAPETGRRGETGQPGGREARRALQVKVSGLAVNVEVMETDPYGRTVGVVRLAGRDINREMVGDGWAWAYRHYLEGPYASAYLGAEKSARTRRAGLWNRSNHEPPWEFRHRREQAR